MPHALFLSNAPLADGISARNEQRNDGPRGLGDFQQRLNRDNGRNGRPRSAQETPRGSESVRSARNGWDATPRDPSGADGNWGGVRNRRWDAPTPRASRNGRAGEDDDEAGGLGRFDMREWEEEQTQLDRDWYMANEDGTLVSRKIVHFTVPNAVADGGRRT